MANDRLYQEPVEVIISPTDQKARLSHVPVEAVVSPTDQKARTYQLVVEVVYPASNPTGATGRAWGYVLG